MFQTDIVDKNQNTHFRFSNFFFNCAMYEIMWKNIVEPDTPNKIIWHMCFACWIAKAANTYRICDTYCFSSATVVVWAFIHTLPVFL